MDRVLVNIKLKSLASYLLMRMKLRFLGKSKPAVNTANVRIFNQNVALDTQDLEQKYLAADCVREPENLIVYQAIAESGLVDTFIDIGANCGHVAASVKGIYKNLILIEPNPSLANLLRNLFASSESVTLHECAVVDEESVGTLTLTVPEDSSGLATLGGTALSEQHAKSQVYNVKAVTLASILENVAIDKSYIKIDVEGFEVNIISSAKKLISTFRPVVGFEALSKESALKCANLFDDYEFYCARFDFLENRGALSRSAFGIVKATILGGGIDILKLQSLQDCSLENFSQIYSVPKEKVQQFERAIASYAAKNSPYDLRKVKTWSK